MGRLAAFNSQAHEMQTMAFLPEDSYGCHRYRVGSYRGCLPCHRFL
jgi:hypothetical protein